MARGIRRLARGSRTRREPDRAPAPLGLRELLDALPLTLRRQALTHSSWVEHRADSYGRLAFLGDSVLGLAIAEHLFSRYPRADIGRLTKMHGQAVSGRACAEVAVELGVPDAARRGRAGKDRRRDRGRGAARLRAGARLRLRGGDRRLLPAPRLRGHLAGDRRRVHERDRDRLGAPARLQIGAAGAPGARRSARKVRGDRGVRAPARPRLRGQRERQRRGHRPGFGAVEEGRRAGRRRAALEQLG